MSEDFGLIRVLGLGDLVAIEIRATVVGAGIFSLTALSASLTGASTPLVFLAAAIVMPRRLPELYKRADFKLKGVMLYAAPIIAIVARRDHVR